MVTVALRCEQQLRDRLADEVRAADDHRLGALERDAACGRAAPSRPSGVHGRSPGALHSRPALIGVSPSTSLAGSISALSAVAVELVRQRAAAAGCR